MVVDDSLCMRIYSFIDYILINKTIKQIKQKIDFTVFCVRHLGLIVTAVTINGFTPVIQGPMKWIKSNINAWFNLIKNVDTWIVNNITQTKFMIGLQSGDHLLNDGRHPSSFGRRLFEKMSSTYRLVIIGGDFNKYTDYWQTIARRFAYDKTPETWRIGQRNFWLGCFEKKRLQPTTFSQPWGYSTLGCISVILLRQKMEVAPYKHDVISMPSQQFSNIKHISIEKYHPEVLLCWDIWTNQNNRWTFMLPPSENRQNFLGWLTVLCSQMRQQFVIIAKISGVSEQSIFPSEENIKQILRYWVCLVLNI